MSVKINKNGKEYDLGFIPEHYPADRVYRHGDVDDDIDKDIDGIESFKSVALSLPNVSKTYELESSAYSCYFVCGQRSSSAYFDVIGVNTIPIIQHLGAGTDISYTGVSTTKVRITLPAYFSGFICSGKGKFTISELT